MTDADALELIANLQAWAKEKFGEREFKYYRINYRWSQSRTASGRPRRDGGYSHSLTNQPEVSKEEYEAGHAAGRREQVRAFMGERKGGWFDTFEKKQVKDGWQDELQKLVVNDGGASERKPASEPETDTDIPF